MLFAFLVACATPTPESFAEDYAVAICDAQVRCGGEDEDSYDLCVSGMSDAAQAQYVDCAADWDDAQAARCIAQLEAKGPGGEGCDFADQIECYKMSCL